MPKLLTNLAVESKSSLLIASDKRCRGIVMRCTDFLRQSQTLKFTWDENNTNSNNFAH